MDVYVFLIIIDLVFGSFAVYLLYLANSTPTKKSSSTPAIKSNSTPAIKSNLTEEENDVLAQNILGDRFEYDDSLYDENGVLKKGVNSNVQFEKGEVENVSTPSVETEKWDIIDPWEYKKKKKLKLKSNSSRMSSGELEVMKALKFYNIQFESEYMLPKYRYRWDFFCPEYNLYIEYDGQQHFFPKSFGEETEEKVLEDFRKRQLADRHKDDIVQSIGGHTLRIPFNKKDETGILIKDKIQEIENRTNPTKS